MNSQQQSQEQLARLYAPLLLAALFVICAGLHRAQLSDHGAYVQSWLIPVEFLLLVGCLGTLLMAAGFTLAHTLKRESRLAIHGLLSIAISIGVIIAGAYLDAPTIIYMT